MPQPDINPPKFDPAAMHRDAQRNLKEVLLGYFALEKTHPERFEIQADLAEDYQGFHVRIWDRQQGEAEEEQLPEEDRKGKLIMDQDFKATNFDWVKSVARVLSMATGDNYLQRLEEIEQMAQRPPE